jgi:hypothetical protein
MFSGFFTQSPSWLLLCQKRFFLETVDFAIGVGRFLVGTIAIFPCFNHKSWHVLEIDLRINYNLVKFKISGAG